MAAWFEVAGGKTVVRMAGGDIAAGELVAVVESSEGNGATITISGVTELPVSATPTQAAGSQLVPIVLGGPWSSPGARAYWTTRLDAQRNKTLGCGCSSAVRVWGGRYYCRPQGGGEWYLPVKVNAAMAAGSTLSFLAPEGWAPTPDTIPEGCYIKTPEGYDFGSQKERCCGNCAATTGGFSGCLGGREYWAQVCSRALGGYAKWCPKPQD